MSGGATSGAERRRRAARDFLRDQDVGEQREVRAVLFGGAHGHDHGVARLQELLDFEVGHLSQEHGRRLHSAISVCGKGYQRHFFKASIMPSPTDTRLMSTAASACRWLVEHANAFGVALR